MTMSTMSVFSLTALLCVFLISQLTVADSTKYLRPCYFTNWAQYRPGRGKYVPEDYIPGLCTHIIYAFGTFGSDFKAKAFDPADLPGDWSGANMYARVNNLKKYDVGLKTSLSFGGWNFGTALFKAMASTAQNRATFIQSAIAFVRQYDFDGIDIDWEYPDNADDTRNYAQFFKELRAAVDGELNNGSKQRLLVTAAVSAGKEKIDAGFDVPALAKTYDFLMLMSYDFHGAWETHTGENSPLYGRNGESDEDKVLNTNFAAKYWADKGMPKEKIIVGMGMYGRGWTLTDPNNSGIGAPGTAARPTEYAREAGISTYYELCELVAAGARRVWQDEQKVPYLVQGDQWWGYDDVQSIQNKMNWVKQQGYGGAFVWALDLDDFNGKCSNGNGKRYPLISVIAKELGGIDIGTGGGTTAPTTPTTPTTTAHGGTTTTTTANPSGPFKCQHDGIFPDPQSCTHYYECANGIPYRFECPKDTEFNKAISTCDYPQNAHCSIP